MTPRLPVPPLRRHVVAAVLIALGLTSAVSAAAVARHVRRAPVERGVPPTFDGRAAPATSESTRLTARDRARPPTTAPRAMPLLLRVPALGIAAPIDAVGVRQAGDLAIPDDVRRVGWYRFGPVPGSPGSAVIAGHVDSARQGAGALFRLRDLGLGAHVEVVDEGGRVQTFVVVAVRQYPKQALPADVWSRVGAPRLAIVTCGGDFVHGHYTDNVVAYATPGA